MFPDRSTPVPNIVFDEFIRYLKPAELTVLLIVIRQTIGWVDKNSNRRKRLDWISGSQLRKKTGYSRKAISTAILGLVAHGLIKVYGDGGRELRTAHERKGKVRLYYGFCIPFNSELSPPEYKVRNPSVQTTQDVRTYYAQQKKLLLKKMNLR